jgi:hypothetical protein
MKNQGQIVIRSLLLTLLSIACSFQSELTAQELLAKKVIQHQSEGSWKDTRQELNSYDNQGRISHTIYQQMKDGAWNNQTKMAYTYDEQSGMEKERIFYQWKDGEWKPNLRFTAERDQQDRLINEQIDEYKEGNWQLSRKNSTRYQKDIPHKSEQIYYSLKNDQWVENYKDQYRFEGNKLVEKTGFQMREGAWEKSLLTSYSYDDQGNRTKETSNRYTTDGILEWRKTSFTYSSGLKTEALIFVKKDEQWQQSQRHRYHYISL